MFELLRSPSKSAAGAILYVTVGTLLVIWSGLWYFYFLSSHPEAPVLQRYACVGSILSGLAIVAIGLLFGLIGHGAKNADNTVGMAPAGPVVAAIPSGVAPVGAVVTPAVGDATPVNIDLRRSVAVPPAHISRKDAAVPN